ncbi:bifunctional hydroxymethylpyrimidine kinase/phosphomethylpyrimidine kinase [Celeribacter indicus]|uniref:hydroxymethylpyrimidine kinase n=1 Tax=Celeribacter indicus TaxID=1208324 RepID=A0A0B5DYY5_9RHOB|nr:bifunctional hydroxymethylpyrimidine kinase/phosphomethylpyrimidine kinase [Celeribacter indicus]AJE45442.1 phosphomethylpyrimidine kinase ThiD [Celeribacter indicus]SDX02091.1 hydroxymethylpyrimidine/phosphomethylpyrimidine kinase [Celeribacter indicus]
MNAPVLFVGGLDSSGGAGILRDCATAAELGAPARVAATAVTAQTDQAVSALHPVPSETVVAQIAAAGAVGAVKLGMLGAAEIVAAVARSLPETPLVIDPVLRSSSGRDLLDPAGRAALVELLVPRCDLLTPNLPELGALGRHLGTAGESATVEALMRRGCRAVLVKGGHAAGGAVVEDRLHRPGMPVQRFCAPRVDATLRGTGCQLASAVAVHLSRAVPPAEAVGRAKAQMQRRFEAAARPATSLNAPRPPCPPAVSS